MNERLREPRATLTAGRGDAATLEARFARRIVARLSEDAESVPHDVAERLRFARMQALERARALRPAPSTPVPARAGEVALAGAGGRPAAPREPSAWWVRLATALPLAALLGGLVLIQQRHVEQQIATAAEIDADLLTDAVPPSAYDDAGFLEFLKTPRD